MIDLHTHSTASDGCLSPTELIELAISSGVEALGLTDHDTVSGLKELRRASEGKKIEIVNGAELSVYYPGAEMEIIALDIPVSSLPAFVAYQQKELARRNDLAYLRIQKLQAFGYNISYEDVAFDEQGHQREQIRRPHFADVLLKKGYIKNVEEAYSGVFAKNGAAYVENRAAVAKDIIHLIRDNGAQAIMAHPIHTELNKNDLFETIKELVKEGLNGIEVFHSSQSVEQRREYLEIIRTLGLKTGGGSDYHGGTAHPENKLGTGRHNNLNIPYFVLEELREPHAPSQAYYDELEKYL